MLPTPYAWESSIRLEWDHCHFPVILHSISSLCQTESKWLLYLGVARWQRGGFVVINAAYNNSTAFQSFIVHLVVATIFVAVHTKAIDGRSKVSFKFQSCLLVSTALSRPFIRLFVNSALCIDCCQTIYWVQSTNMCKTALIYSNT